MEAVKDPDSLRNQTIERLIELYQTPLLRLCYVHEEETIMEICRQAFGGNYYTWKSDWI